MVMTYAASIPVAARKNKHDSTANADFHRVPMHCVKYHLSMQGVDIAAAAEHYHNILLSVPIYSADTGIHTSTSLLLDIAALSLSSWPAASSPGQTSVTLSDSQSDSLLLVAAAT